MYNPLPDSLDIQNSSIHGRGLFAVLDIPAKTNFGTSHVKFNSEMIRTALGAFYNHSESPNCIKVLRKNQYKTWYELESIKDIKAGEELTVSYTMYKI